MKTIQYGSGLPVPAFNVPESDSWYWLKRIAYEDVRTIDALRIQGVGMDVAEPSDFDPVSTDVNQFISDYGARFDQILATGASSIIPALPDVISIISSIMASGGSAVLPILLNAVLTVLSRQSGLVNGGASDSDNSDIVAAIDRSTETQGRIFLDNPGTPEESSKIDTLNGVMPDVLSITLRQRDYEENFEWSVDSE